MYLNDNTKCITKNESNIPVPKSSGKKKSQGRSQFPELQKYIETIIKASNGCDSEDVSDSGEKTAKVGKSGNNTMQIENKKVNKRKLNINLNSEKLNERTKTTVSVSSRENISNQFFSDFDDPRNWDIVTAQKDIHKNIKIEKALKNLFPNPYKLLQIPEFKKTKISMYIEKIGNDDVTLPDVIISEFDAQKTTDSTRVQSIFEADCDKSSSQMELWSLNSRDKIRRSDAWSKNNDKTVASFSDGSALNATSNYSKNLGSDKSNNSISRQNSFENVKDCESSRTKKTGERDFGRRKASKSKKSTDLLDYDIGKLKFLTLTDSDDSSKDPSRDVEKKLKEDFKNHINANESSRVDKLEISPNGLKESRMVKECFNELSHKHKVNQTEARNRSKSDGRERKALVKGKSKRKKSICDSIDGDDCPKGVENDLGIYEERNTEVKSKKMNAAEEKKLNYEAMEKTGEKIDEVLQFMCDCLMKFRYEGDTVNGSSVKDINVTEKTKSKWPNLDKPPNRSPFKPEEDLSTLELNDLEIPKVLFHIPNSKRRKTATYSRSEKKFQLLRLDQNEIHIPDVPDTVYPDSAAISEQNVVHTVETQNELGGYTEEQQHQTQVSAKSNRLSKSVLPMSVKIKQRKLDAYDVLKNALETEERLLSGRFTRNSVSKNDFIEKPVDMLTRESHSSCSVIGTYKRQHSNFVICVNSLPRNMKSGRLAGFSLCPWTISLDEIRRTIIKPLPYYQTLCSEEVQFTGAEVARQQERMFEIPFAMYRSTTSHFATPIGVSVVVGSSKMHDEILLKSSETRITKEYKPTKTSFYVKPSTPPKTIACIIKTCQKLDLDLTSSLDDQVGELEDAVERTEKVYFLEQDCNATYTISETSTGSRNEVFKNLEWNEENEKRKLHNLLMRTYNLQQKLHRHLKILTDKPISISCPSIQQEKSTDFAIKSRNSETVFRPLDNPSDDAMVYWYLQTPQRPNVLDEAILVKVQKTDRWTSYDPPQGEKIKNVGDDEDINDDDRSSTYSFKSSNDFSENEKELKVPQTEENSKNVRFLENIFHEIDLFKNRLMLEKSKDKDVEKKDWTEKGVMESCEGIKTPTKLLKTVFKGKKSLTELSLGLKAVPLAKVSNISVEKRKISENHTKISICISKEKGNEFPQDQSTTKELMHSRLSYYLDSIRPSLSSCRTEYSKLENEIRRGESEDEEDDFKSVLSTLSRPHSEMNLVNEVTEVKKLEMAPTPKSFNKHRFDFYQKMDTSHKVRQKSLSNTSCTYKEFEPLKQALTEMQIRMRSIKRDAYFNSNDYYQRALKLAKMSAGYCQSCGSRSVIPQDTFGYYKTMLPRNHSHRHRGCYLKATHPRSSYYSLRSAELSDQFADLDLQKSSSYLVNSSRTIIRNPLNDIPIFSGTL